MEGFLILRQIFLPRELGITNSRNISAEPALSSLSWLVDFEAEYSGYITLCSLLWLQMPICHQEQVRERGPKIGSIDIALVLGPRIVDIFTSWTVYFYSA